MFLTAAQVLLALLLVLLVLLQSPGSDSLSGFSSATQCNLGALFNRDSPSSFMAKLTAVVAAAFIVNTLLLVGTGARGMREVSLVSETEAISAQDDDNSDVPLK